MKTFKMICLFFIIVLTLSGCDTGSSSTNKNAPKITDVELYRWNDVQWVLTSRFYVGDWVNYRVFVYDPNEDIRYLYLMRYYPEDSMIPYTSVETFYYSSTSAPETVLTLRDPLQIIGGPTGTWRLEIQVEDAKGNLSNIWEEYVEVHY